MFKLQAYLMLHLVIYLLVVELRVLGRNKSQVNAK